jgi:hypothetical protein
VRDLRNDRIRLTLSDVTPGSFGVLVLGASNTRFGSRSLPTPLDLVGLPQCLLYQSIDIAIPMVTGTAGLDAGYAAIEVPLPYPLAPYQHPIFPIIHAQWLVADPRAQSFTGTTRALSIYVNHL